MNYFTKTVMVVLLVFVGWSTIYAQELLSDVVNIGSNQKYIIAETTDGPYIITINTQDSVKVYKIEGESATLQYANYFISISGEYYIYSKGDFMFLSTPEGAVAYDFVADEQYLFPYSGELIRSQWYTYSSSNADQVKLSMTSSNYSPRVYSIFDLKSKEMVPFEHVDNIRHIHNDFYVLEEYINEDTTIISIYDRESEAIVEEFLPYPYSLSIHNDEVLYFKDNNLLRYDFYAGEDEIIYELEDGIDPSIRAAILENHYILSYRINSEEISVIIDKETHESWACDYYIKEFKYEEVNNQLILSDYTDILLYDLDTRSSTILETNSRIQDVSIIKDRYLLHNYTYILGTNVVAVNALYDTHDGTSTDVGGDKVYASFLRPEVIDIDGGSLINFSTNLASDHELLYYDEEDHTVFPSHIVPAAPLGILNDSELFLSHEDIILGNNQNIYAVLQDSISELTGEYYNKSYSDLHHVGEVGLFWAEVTSQNFSFYTYKDGVKSHVGTITADDIEGGFYPASLDHYYITEESIYFSAFKFTEKRLYRYSRTDESVEIMMDLESFSRDQFIGALSETVYYENEGLLYVLRPG